MDFSSDTSAPAHPSVIEALGRVNTGNAASYGADDQTKRLRRLLEEVFETADFDFWLCASGTASNALALSVMASPTGAILCHEEAHIQRDERGAPTFFTGGASLRLLPGCGARIEAQAFAQALAENQPDFVHETPLEVLSLTNLTESGQAYRPDEIRAFCEAAKRAGLRTHLDGARLANALSFTGASPAEMSWQAGIDVLTLGLTKTGAIGCEIILLFADMRTRFDRLKAQAKRSGHMPPKMRFLSAQALALLEQGLWLDLAQQANQQARKLANALCADPGTRLAFPVEGNEVFAILSEDLKNRLIAEQVSFYPWTGAASRFVCHWATTDREIDLLFRLVHAQP